MQISIDDQVASGCVSCIVSGNWITAELKRYIDLVAVEAGRRNCDRVLADLSTVIGTPPDLDRYATGKYIAAVLNDKKTAIVYHKVRPDNFFEDTAINRGASIKVFSDRENALKWLLE